MSIIELRCIFQKIKNNTATETEKEQFKQECLLSSMSKEWLYSQIIGLDRECNSDEIKVFDDMLESFD